MKRFSATKSPKVRKKQKKCHPNCSFLHFVYPHRRRVQIKRSIRHTPSFRYNFQSTRPARGATRDFFIPCVGIIISIHAPCEGRDSLRRIFHLYSGDFNPRALRGARRGFFNQHAAFGRISIHAPCEGRDMDYLVASGLTKISIHAPCEGRDAGLALPLRRSAYFNPRALRGARLSVRINQRDLITISIHAPCEGRDIRPRWTACKPFISIHAPCEGRDCMVKNTLFYHVFSTIFREPSLGRPFSSMGS